LTKLPNVVLTPHIGGFSDKMFVSFWELSAESIVAMARGELPESFVNPAVVPNSGFAAAAGAHPRL
jgi:phosphoglycerate dehydrogenase-like enzyme